MNIRLAEDRVREWAAANSKALGFRRSQIEVDYIWNPGGLVNQSYRLSDGELVCHLKLAPDRNAPRLRQWARISDRLTDHYHAPRLIGEVTQELVPGYAFGLVFEFVQGKPVSQMTGPQPVLEQVLDTLNGLHKDREIRQVLANETSALTYADAFFEEYISRYEDDMEIVRASKHHLPFVTEASIEWFDTEVEALKQLVRQHPSFSSPATDVVHNDMHWDNVLAVDASSFWIIDWDGLTVNGDAAMDFSVLLWPLYQSGNWPYWRERVVVLAGPEILDRLELYFRAKLLDDVIDLLADYVEAETMPEIKEKTQQRAKEIHLRAYSAYLKLYGR